jgi:hypothetical protein
MSLFIIVAAVASLAPALYTACGEVRDRVRSQRLTREVARAFRTE